MNKPLKASFTHKVRRPALGMRRAQGRRYQLIRKARRPDPRKIRPGEPDPSLTRYGGLIDFGRYTRTINVEQTLVHAFGDLKLSPWVVYPMPFVVRTFVDLYVLGGARPFDIEHAAADAGFRLVVGGLVPSVDVLYDDLRRFDEPHLLIIDQLVADQGIALTRCRRYKTANLDIDPTVMPVFGKMEGAAVGYNPQFHGRPAYHPVVSRLAESGAILGGLMRVGNTTFGKAAFQDDTELFVRIDSAGDCEAIMRGIYEEEAHFLIKARITEDLQKELQRPQQWKTMEKDADGKPEVQLAELKFRRDVWGPAEGEGALPVRVIAVRRNDRERRSPSFLWPEMDWIVDVYLTSDLQGAAYDLVKRYDGRAGIEPLIAEGKIDWHLGACSIDSFNANAAQLSLKLLTYNLLHRYTERVAPAQRKWRTSWLRRLLIDIPGRFVRSGRQTVLRLAPRGALIALE